MLLLPTDNNKLTELQEIKSNLMKLSFSVNKLFLDESCKGVDALISKVQTNDNKLTTGKKTCLKASLEQFKATLNVSADDEEIPLHRFSAINKFKKKYEDYCTKSIYANYDDKKFKSDINTFDINIQNLWVKDNKKKEPRGTDHVSAANLKKKENNEQPLSPISKDNNNNNNNIDSKDLSSNSSLQQKQSKK